MLYTNSHITVKAESTIASNRNLEDEIMLEAFCAEYDAETLRLQALKTTVTPVVTFDKSSTSNIPRKPDSTHEKKVTAPLAHEGCLVTLPSPPPTPSDTPITTPIAYTRCETPHERMIRLYWFPKTTAAIPSAPTPDPLPTRWRDLSPVQIFNLSTRSAERAAGDAFSLNLSAQIEKSAAVTADPAAFIAARITRALKAFGLAGMPFALTIEATHTGRLHIHGVVLAGDADLDLVKRSLMNAGGKLPGRSASRQLSLTPLTDALGWAGYCAKDESRTRREVMGERLVFISRSMSVLGKALHTADKPTPAPKTLHNTPTPPETHHKAPLRLKAHSGTLPPCPRHARASGGPPMESQ